MWFSYFTSLNSQVWSKTVICIWIVRSRQIWSYFKTFVNLYKTYIPIFFKLGARKILACSSHNFVPSALNGSSGRDSLRVQRKRPRFHNVLFQSTSPAGPASPCSLRLLPDPRRRSWSSPWGKTLRSPDSSWAPCCCQGKTQSLWVAPHPRARSPSRWFPWVTSCLMCPFCSLTVLLRPCHAHPVWPNFMEVSASLTASYVLDLLLQNSP